MENTTLAPETTEAVAEEKKTKANIEFDPIVFDSDATTMFVSGRDICQKIDSLFKAVWVDYVGCRLQINDGLKADVINRTIPRNSLYVDLIFRENSSEGFHALKRRSETKGTSLQSRINFVMGGQYSRAYTFDEDVLESLEEFLPYNPNKGKKIDWFARTCETNNVAPAMPYGFNAGGYIEVAILGFPVELLLKKIYGGEINKEKFDYSCNILRSTVNGTDLVLQVTKLNVATVNKLYNIVGLANSAVGGFYGNAYHIG